ncbi:MAG: alpha/beta hydrolase [Myxococcota bacterium]
MSFVVATAIERAARWASFGLTLPFKPDELYRAPTSDGASIALGRYRPRVHRRFAEPVVLCHGLGANRFSFDFDERHSLARHLARRGFETWVLELRGRGLAGPARDTTFDEQAEHDVAAALRTVLSTGAKAVTWVGHSKGGLLMYAHLAKNPLAPVKALCTVGSPVSFETHAPLRRFMAKMGPALALSVIPVASLARAAARFGMPPAPLGPYLAREENMDPEVVKRAIANVSADVAGGVGRQFARWIRTGRFDTNDGSFDYRAHLHRLRLPLLAIAGAKDLLAPPATVSPVTGLVSAPTRYVLAGLDGGFARDYGHGDLVLGRHAPEELFPLVEEFLSTHSTPALLGQV